MNKPTPIRRKGCKNVGWVWNEGKTEKLVVPLDLKKEWRYVSEMVHPSCEILEIKNIYRDPKTGLLTVYTKQML